MYKYTRSRRSADRLYIITAMAYSTKFKTFKVADNITIMIFRTSPYDTPAVGKYVITDGNRMSIFANDVLILII